MVTRRLHFKRTQSILMQVALTLCRSPVATRSLLMVSIVILPATIRFLIIMVVIIRLIRL